MRTHRLLAGTAAALLVLGACGGSDDDASSNEPLVTLGDEDAETDTSEADGTDADAPDAPAGGDADAPDLCALFSQADAEAATGTKLVLDDEQQDGSCLYSAADPIEMTFAQVSYQVGALSDGTTVDQIAAGAKGYETPEEAELQVVQVGSADAVAFDLFGVSVVMMPHGDNLVSVGVMGNDLAAATTLAEVVAGNL